MAELIYRAFVSSTYEDLKDERAEVTQALLKLQCLPIGMEAFPATDMEVWEFIKEQIEASDFYVMVIAGRYGSLGPDGRSLTEMEYDYAREIGKPVLTFIHAAPGEIAHKLSETDPEKTPKLAAFIAKAKAKPLVSFFRSPQELAGHVLASVVDLRPRLLKTHPEAGYVRY